ncbi:MAG TPA: RNA methyltransferase [Candidatus Krumholzibacteria bacterium]|nr:RNA methyltransferase [Candidatus Krumholzibacteria bacterium]HPD71004.1 RNA methyltransferase [Candidatus Krumholzibacteria bacterium]HRY39296.1 RNA methyltransferase [Candidatus Krumholzibacteria bacterium]
MPDPTSQQRCPIYALLDNVRSAWNVGSMFRTADAAGLSGLYLCGMTATPPRTDLEKTALGATSTMPWDYWTDTLAAIRTVRERGIQVVALECAPGAAPFDAYPYRFPLCFLVGHEVRGISPAVLAACDAVVAVPMYGGKESLNVAVCFGIMAYEARRRWSVQATNSSRQA